LRWNARQAVEFVARRHQQSETRQLREVRGELAKCARLHVRAPIVSAHRDTIEHASGRCELRFEIREQSREWGPAVPSQCSTYSAIFLLTFLPTPSLICWLFFDLLEDLERADVLAMDHFVKGSSII